MSLENPIQLINCTPEILTHIISGDEVLARELDLNVPKDWSTFGLPAFRYTQSILNNNPAAAPWWTYLPILTASRTLIGSCGYKGLPDEMGIVEIGYEVGKAFRNQGYATTIAQILVKQAFRDPRVKTVQAHTLAEENASVRVLQKSGFKFKEEIEDEEDGKIWKWICLP